MSGREPHAGGEQEQRPVGGVEDEAEQEVAQGEQTRPRTGARGEGGRGRAQRRRRGDRRLSHGPPPRLGLVRGQGTPAWYPSRALTAAPLRGRGGVAGSQYLEGDPCSFRGPLSGGWQ
jgi:hypothetical protein